MTSKHDPAGHHGRTAVSHRELSQPWPTHFPGLRGTALLSQCAQGECPRACQAPLMPPCSPDTPQTEGEM